MTNFKVIRTKVLEKWYKGLIRSRKEGELTDDYDDSPWCKIQNECTDNKIHCSFICSLNDWLDNISDLLHDNRFDELNEEDYEILFRYYTRILLLVSEVIEDFIMLNNRILNLKSKKKSTKDFETGTLSQNELKDLSEFINTVCKHKNESNNLHIHNHHLKIEFIDFGAIEHDNQIRLNNQVWTTMDKETTILMASLNYFIELVIKTNNKVLQYIETRTDYKTKLLEIYADEWHNS